MASKDLEQVPEGWRTRIRYGAKQRQRFVIKLRDRAAAEKRDAELRELARMLTKAGHAAQALTSASVRRVAFTSFAES